MVDYREILRLRSLGNNITQIANAIHSSRHTVREVEQLADEKGISWPVGEELSNERLRCFIRNVWKKRRYILSLTAPLSIRNWRRKVST